MEIVFNIGKRELKKFDGDITQYYKDLAELWNVLEKLIAEPTDGRRPKYNLAYNNFFYKLLFLSDMIIQTKIQHYKEVEQLKEDLNKWTANQTGRKPILTAEQKEIIKIEKASGASNIALANQYNVSEGTIRNVLKKIK